MVLEKLGSALRKVITTIASTVFFDKSKIDAIIKDLQRALLEADVDVKLVFELCEKIRKQALQERSPLEKREQLIKLIHDELVDILGKEKYESQIDKRKRPYKIMFLGLYGCGKTTTIAKLALYYSKRGYKCCMLGLDVHRPAAPEQLEQLAQQVKLPYFINKKEKNPLRIWQEYRDKTKKFDIVFIDTAGRDAFDKELVKEIKSLDEAIKPEQTILVMSADIGQAAKKQSAEFQKACAISGVIITRLDGTAKGGGALAACTATGAKVLFVGTGEKLRDIETFNPTAFVSRLLGMGDLQALLEKAKSVIEEKAKKKIEKRLEEGKFTLLDLHEQLKAMQKMGPLSKMAELIPGLGKLKLPQGLLEKQEDKLQKWKYAIDSCTKEERENPEIITGSRIARIAKGAGINASDVRDLLKQYKLIKSFLGQGKAMGLSQKKLAKLAKRFGGKLPF